MVSGDVDRYIDELDRALRGPRRAKRSLLAEARRRAVADFGAVAEVAPGYQAELAATQSRLTGLAIIAALGLQIVAWDHSWPMFPETTAAPPDSPAGLADSAVEVFGSVCLLLAVGLVVGARFAARRPGLRTALGRVTAGLGWTVGAFLIASAVVLNLLNPTAAQVSPALLAVPLIAFVGLPVAGPARSSRRCLALAGAG